MTLIYTHPTFALHETPPGHPEQSARMGAVETGLKHGSIAHLPRRTAEPAPYEAIARAHPSAYIDKMAGLAPPGALIAIDADTTMGPHSWEAARLASGAAMAATDAIMAGEDTTAFIASRPPGHHAERTRAMGFCLINHVVVAARHAQAAHGVGRVAIVDFDVHHGNGTQDMAQDDPSILYISSHGSPLYPGTGAAHETGVGNILNIPLPAGTGGTAYREVMSEAIVPALDAFAPEFLILSAGFDAHADDPLGNLAFADDDYVWITEEMRTVAERHTGGRVLSVLEGGYNLAALARSVTAHVGALAA